jgi:hypothetical protein
MEVGVGERPHRGPDVPEDPRDVGVAGEDEHLPFPRLVGDEFHQHFGGRAGAAVVEVDQRIVDHDRQMDAVAFEVADEGQSKGEEHLLTGATTESIGVPERSLGIVDLEPGFVDGRRDLGVVTLREPHQPP